MTQTGRPNLTALLAQANALTPDSSTDEIARIVAAIRSALAAGVGANQDALRDFLSVSFRFGHYADTWNASQLLTDQGELDPYAKAARAAAWLRLFPDTAISRPKLVLQLLGEGGTGGVTDGGRSGLISGWLDWMLQFNERTNDNRVLTRALLAAGELAACWWPEDSWLKAAPAFSASFVSTALRVAEDLRADARIETGGLAKALGTALRLQRNLQEVVDDEPVTVETAGSGHESKVADALHGREVMLGAVELKSIAEELNRTRRRIWVVGALQPKWEHLMGIAKGLGLEPAVFEHVDYNEVKQVPMIRRINLVRDFGILLGPIPHSASEVGDYSSLATQLRAEAGVHVVELRANSQSRELRITKSSFKTGLLRLLTEGLLHSYVQSSGASTPSTSAAAMTP